MAKLAAVIVDTYEQNTLARLAIEQTVATGLVDRVYTFSTAPIYAGEEFHRINPIRSAADYSHFMLNIVPHFVDADSTLVIQWDGMPCNEALWTSEFLAYDYIGAPWDHAREGMVVGNGGFSLRSRRLMDLLATMKLHCPDDMAQRDAEDVVICKHFRHDFERAGCQFAPVALATRFSVENTAGEGSFGFHGVWNFPACLPGQFPLHACAELCTRTPNDFFLANFLLACLRCQNPELYQATVAALEAAGRHERMAQFLDRQAVRLPLF